MSNSKDNKNNQINSTELTKKNSLPLIVGTGAMIIASVMTLEPSISLEVAKINSLNSACYVQNQDDKDEKNLENDDDFLNQDDEEDTSSTSNKSSAYVRGRNGELFYNSSAEDDNYCYGDWDRIDPDEIDDDDEFFLW